MDTLTALSSITSGLSSFGDAMQYAGVASANKQQAGLLDLEGKSVIESADYTARRQREQGDRFLANQVATYAKAGVRFTGSPALVWAESEKNIRMDILATHLNAANKANALGFEALNRRIAAGQARTRQVQAIGQGILQMATTAAMSGGSGGGATKAGGVGNGQGVLSVQRSGNTIYRTTTVM